MYKQKHLIQNSIKYNYKNYKIQYEIMIRIWNKTKIKYNKKY
jgi:hypothetical protein